MHFIKTNLLSDVASQINSPHEMVFNEINTDTNSINKHLAHNKIIY